MKKKGQDRVKEHYQLLRTFTCEQLWQTEVPKFNAASPKERIEQVSLVRAVGVVFADAGNAQQKEDAKKWLKSLLEDPQEKIRRYAMTALPKIGSGADEELQLLTLLQKTDSERETKALAKTLEKIGGEATLGLHQTGAASILAESLQKVQANVARTESPSTIDYKTILPKIKDIQINLRCRSGLEKIVSEELESRQQSDSKFRITRTLTEIIKIEPTAPFNLSELYQYRTFSEASFVLGTVEAAENGLPIDAIATVVSGPLAEKLLTTFTKGPVRYRLEFLFKDVSTSAVRKLADQVYKRNPKLLNDSRNAPWEINIYRLARGYSVELTPKLRPDPRFAYRQGDVPAASHPPLSAALARLAGPHGQETVWDPFCGSGLELIERGLLGGVKQLIGTDLAPEAITTTGANLKAAFPSSIPNTLVCCDFRDYRKVKELRNITLIITNPPLGKRVPIPDLKGLIEDVIRAAADVLKPGGRLVLVNPFLMKPVDPSLKLEFRQKTDLGCFHCYIEKYQKLPS